MKFQTILSVSDLPDREGHIFTKKALMDLAEEDPKVLHYEERDGRGYLIENKVIEISEESYFSNPKHAWANHIYLTSVPDKLEEVKR